MGMARKTVYKNIMKKQRTKAATLVWQREKRIALQIIYHIPSTLSSLVRSRARLTFNNLQYSALRIKDLATGKMYQLALPSIVSFCPSLRGHCTKHCTRHVIISISFIFLYFGSEFWKRL